MTSRVWETVPGSNLQETFMQRNYDVKIRGVIGPEPKDGTHIRILNRLLTWGPAGLEYECDPRHAEIIVRDLVP